MRSLSKSALNAALKLAAEECVGMVFSKFLCSSLTQAHKHSRMSTQLDTFLYTNTILFNWLYILIMSHTHFRVNLYSIVAWMSRNSLLETGAKFKWLQQDWNPQPLVRKRTLNHLAKLAKRLSCVVSTYPYGVCSYHVTYAVHSESTLYSWPAWLNSWEYVYKLSGESRCSHLNFRYRSRFE